MIIEFAFTFKRKNVIIIKTQKGEAMKTLTVIILFSLLLVSCSQEAPTPDPTLLAVQTEYAQVQVQLSDKDATLVYVLGQYHWLQSATPETIVKVVTTTFTPTPKHTPTITNTPEPTNTQTPTIDPLKRSRGNGFYLIGVDIAPGVWRSNGSGDSCYWAVTRADGDIIDNHFGMSGGTAYIPEYGYQVQFEDCGTWTFIQDP